MEDLIPEDVAAMSHQHWLDFPPSHPFVADFVGIVFFLLSIINFFGNAK